MQYATFPTKSGGKNLESLARSLEQLVTGVSHRGEAVTAQKPWEKMSQAERHDEVVRRMIQHTKVSFNPNTKKYESMLTWNALLGKQEWGATAKKEIQKLPFFKRISDRMWDVNNGWGEFDEVRGKKVPGLVKFDVRGGTGYSTETAGKRTAHVIGVGREVMPEGRPPIGDSLTGGQVTKLGIDDARAQKARHKAQKHYIKMRKADDSPTQITNPDSPWNRNRKIYNRELGRSAPTTGLTDDFAEGQQKKLQMIDEIQQELKAEQYRIPGELTPLQQEAGMSVEKSLLKSNGIVIMEDGRPAYNAKEAKERYTQLLREHYDASIEKRRVYIRQLREGLQDVGQHSASDASMRRRDTRMQAPKPKILRDKKTGARVAGPMPAEQGGDPRVPYRRDVREQSRLAPQAQDWVDMPNKVNTRFEDTNWFDVAEQPGEQTDIGGKSMGRRGEGRLQRQLASEAMGRTSPGQDIGGYVKPEKMSRLAMNIETAQQDLPLPGAVKWDKGKAVKNPSFAPAYREKLKGALQALNPGVAAGMTSAVHSKERVPRETKWVDSLATDAPSTGNVFSGRIKNKQKHESVVLRNRPHFLATGGHAASSSRRSYGNVVDPHEPEMGRAKRGSSFVGPVPRPPLPAPMPTMDPLGFFDESDVPSSKGSARMAQGLKMKTASPGMTYAPKVGRSVRPKLYTKETGLPEGMTRDVYINREGPERLGKEGMQKFPATQHRREIPKVDKMGNVEYRDARPSVVKTFTISIPGAGDGDWQFPEFMRNEVEAIQFAKRADLNPEMKGQRLRELQRIAEEILDETLTPPTPTKLLSPAGDIALQKPPVRLGPSWTRGMGLARNPAIGIAALAGIGALGAAASE